MTMLFLVATRCVGLRGEPDYDLQLLKNYFNLQGVHKNN